MASRGLEGSPLPSVTSRSNDNKPDGRGAEPLYLDSEGNIRPSDPAAGGVTGREARRPGDAAQPPEGRREVVSEGADADHIRKYNSFNYWRRRLPDVTDELKGSKSRRLHVNADARSPSAIGGNTAPFTKPVRDHAQVRPRSQSRSLSPKPGRSPRPDTLVLFDPEAGESSTDPEPHAGGSWGTTPLNGHHLDLALHRHFDFDDDAEGVSEEQLHLARRRLKSGSFCDYSR